MRVADFGRSNKNLPSRIPKSLCATTAAMSSSSSSAPLSGAMLLETLGGGAAPGLTFKNDGGLLFDVGLLALSDPAPVDPSALAADREKELRRVATENTQLLIKQIFELPVEMTDVGPVVRRGGGGGGKRGGPRNADWNPPFLLPPPSPSLLTFPRPLPAPQAVLPDRTTRLPRAKHVPKPKPMTRWEKFAKEKGIAKKGSRDRMVFDEATGEFKPRWGYKRARDDTGEWGIEYKRGEDTYTDKFEERQLKKKQRVIKNEIGRIGNEMRASRDAEAVSGGGPSISAGPNVRADAILGGSAAGRKGGKKDRKGGKAGVGAVRSAAAAAAAAGGAASVPVGIAPLGLGEGRATGLTDQGRHAKPKPGAPGLGGVKESRDVKAAKVKLAQVSTASMGRVSRNGGKEGGEGRVGGATGTLRLYGGRTTRRALTFVPPSLLPPTPQFDRALAGEPARPKDPRKQVRLPNEIPLDREKSRQGDILRRVLHGSGEGEGAAPGGVAMGGARGAGDGSGSGGGKFRGGKKHRK
jgi:hypothetical protein